MHKTRNKPYTTTLPAIMKLKFLSILIIICTNAFSQVKIDSVISVVFPEKPEPYERSSKDAIVTGYVLKNKKDSFLFFKTIPLNQNGEEIHEFSTSLNELQKNYQYASKRLITAMKDKEFSFLDSTKVKIGEFHAYNLTFSNNNSIGAEYLILELNGVFYFALYSKITEFNEKRKNDFIKSVVVNNINYQNQVSKNSIPLEFIRIGIKVVALLFLGFLIITATFFMVRRYNSR